MSPSSKQSVGSNTALKDEMVREILLSSRSLQLRAKGCSMLPTVRPGDVLVVERVDLQSIKTGDVVVTARDYEFVSHRVISIENDAEELFITRGDTSAIDDSPVRQSDLLGRVTHVIRKGRVISLPSRLRTIDAISAAIFRRSFPALRALLQMRRRLQSVLPTAKEPIAACHR
jgi:signal peptidase I